VESARGNEAMSLRRLAHQPLHLRDGFAHADEDGPADDRMTDVQLAHARKRRHRLHIGVVQRMARVEAHAKLANQLTCVPNLRKLGNDFRSL
jgi:hypothetical protein